MAQHVHQLIHLKENGWICDTFSGKCKFLICKKVV